MAERTALINHLRAVVLERGITVAQGRRKLEKEPHGLLADETSGLSSRIRQLVSDLRKEWQVLDGRIAAFDTEFLSQARTDPAARRLTTVPGDRQHQRHGAGGGGETSRAGATWRPGLGWCHGR